MPSKHGQLINWYNRYWHDWPAVEDAVFAVAKSHVHYLGYEVFRPLGHEMPPGDPAKIGPVMRISFMVFPNKQRHGQPTYEQMYVDVERRAGKFRATGDGFLGDVRIDT